MKQHTDVSLESPGRRRPRLAGALLAGLLVLGACSSDDTSGNEANSDATTTTVDSASALLGPESPASGEPVKIGLISGGKSLTADYSIESSVADATVEYLNSHRAGIAGRPIELVTCITAGDTSKATDCANQLIQDHAIAVVVPSLATDAPWQPLHDAGIPIVFYGAASGKVLMDGESTFVLANSTSGLSDLPIAVAEKTGATKVTAVVIDVPTATAFYTALAPSMFEKAGIELNMVAVPPGTADMTPQMQAVATSDPGVVHVLGDEAFCIAAFNGLRAAGFDGTISTISQCVSDATREAVPGDFLEGMAMTTPAPLGSDDPGILLYEAVVSTFAKDVDVSDAFGPAVFTVLSALSEAMEGVTGDITSATVIATLKSMPEMELPASGGLKFRCNGKATWAPAICTRASLVTTLDAKGQATTPEVVNDTPIED